MVIQNTVLDFSGPLSLAGKKINIHMDLMDRKATSVALSQKMVLFAS